MVFLPLIPSFVNVAVIFVSILAMYKAAVININPFHYPYTFGRSRSTRYHKNIPVVSKSW
jgi:hypothetical protein